MDNNLKIIFNYVNSSLNKAKNKSTTIITNEEDFYFKVIENGLVGLVFPHLNKEDISNKLYSLLQKDFYAYLQKDIKQKSLILKIKDIFNKNEIKHIFLKGAHLKDIYPESFMRAMGDIDILINKEDLNKVHDVFSEVNYKLDSRSLSHDVFKSQDNLFIEIHPGFNVVDDKVFSKLLSSPWDYAVKYKEYEYKFNETYELVYLTYHLAKHMYAGGIGIRSVLDISVFTNYYEDYIKEDLLVKLLDQNNLKTFFCYLIKANNKMFNYNIRYSFIKEDNMNNNSLRVFIDYITKAGIHGVGSNHNTFDSRIISSNKKQSKFIFLMSRAFPSFKEMKGIYPSLNRYWLLLPFYYVARVFKLVFLKGKINLKKVKRISKASEKKETESLFKNIGL